MAASHGTCEASINADAWFKSELGRRVGEQFVVEPATPEHEPFLRALFAANLAESIEALGGDARPIIGEPLLGMQFGSRQATYAAAHPLAYDYVISRRSDRVPVARFLVDWSLQDAPVVWGIDVAVHPARRAGAIGLRLLRAWVETCDHLARPAQLHVVPHNPARRLYHRLGFVELDWTAFPLPMRREPRPCSRAAERRASSASGPRRPDPLRGDGDRLHEIGRRR